MSRTEISESTPAPAVTEGSTYRSFVKSFMQKTAQENPGISPKEAMRKCGIAWRAHKETNAGSSGVTKQKERRPKPAIVLPPNPTTLKGVADFISSIREDGQVSDTPAFSRSVVIAIPRTKQVQRHLKNSVRAFSTELKTGQVQNMEQAFTRGFNSLLQLAHHA